jgi:hypothetical protein
MIYKLSGMQISFYPSTNVVAMRCPACKQIGTFDPVFQDGTNRQNGMADLRLMRGGTDQLFFGQRCCPNPACQAHIFFVFDVSRRQIAVSYPAERIDFDTTKVPQPVVAALEEAITCHANQCFVASAIMVRKALEELCADRGAKGPNLKERIKALGANVVLPTELLNGLDDLRLLGNDAAHIESQEYNKVDQEEVEVAIDVTKEVLKAVYQYSALLDRLKALKKLP